MELDLRPCIASCSARSSLPLLPHADVSQLLQRLHERLGAGFLVAVGGYGGEELGYEGCGGQGEVQLAGDVEGVAQVFLLVPDLEAGLEVAVDHLGAEVEELPGRRSAAGDGVEHGLAGDAGLRRQRQ